MTIIYIMLDSFFFLPYGSFSAIGLLIEDKSSSTLIE
jgi:hypothetical protein